MRPTAHSPTLRRVLAVVFAICLALPAQQVFNPGTSSGGTVTGVTGTSPITSSGGAAPAIGCATCTTSAAALVSGDVVTGAGLQAVQDSGTLLSSLTKTTSTGAWMTMPTTSSGLPTTGATANRASVWGVNLPFAITTTEVTFETITGDTSGGTYDIGFYGPCSSGETNCPLAAHIGNTPAASGFTGTSTKATIAWTGSETLQPGRYYLAITCSATSLCATFAGAGTNAVSFCCGATTGTLVTIASGGTLPATITAPSDAITFASPTPVWLVE